MVQFPNTMMCIYRYVREYLKKPIIQDDLVDVTIPRTLKDMDRLLVSPNLVRLIDTRIEEALNKQRHD